MEDRIEPHFEAQLVQKLNAYCRKKACTYSEKREAILLTLLEIDAFTDAVSLWIFTREKSRVSISCVYSNLRIYVEAGLVATRYGDRGVMLYRVRGR